MCIYFAQSIDILQITWVQICQQVKRKRQVLLFRQREIQPCFGSIHKFFDPHDLREYHLNPPQRFYTLAKLAKLSKLSGD